MKRLFCALDETIGIIYFHIILIYNIDIILHTKDTKLMNSVIHSVIF